MTLINRNKINASYTIEVSIKISQIIYQIESHYDGVLLSITIKNLY